MSPGDVFIAIDLADEVDWLPGGSSVAPTTEVVTEMVVLNAEFPPTFSEPGLLALRAIREMTEGMLIRYDSFKSVAVTEGAISE